MEYGWIITELTDQAELAQVEHICQYLRESGRLGVNTLRVAGSGSQRYR